MGDHIYGKYEGTGLGGETKIVIGDYCSIADGLWIARQDHKVENVITYPFDVLGMFLDTNAPKVNSHTVKNPELHIGNDVWIDRDVKTFLWVTEIGNGVVISAGSIVTKMFRHIVLWVVFQQR